MSCSQSKNSNFIYSDELVKIVCFVVVEVVQEPFLSKEGFNDSFLLRVGDLVVALLDTSTSLCKTVSCFISLYTAVCRYPLEF